MNRHDPSAPSNQGRYARLLASLSVCVGLAACSTSQPGGDAESGSTPSTGDYCFVETIEIRTASNMVCRPTPDECEDARDEYEDKGDMPGPCFKQE